MVLGNTIDEAFGLKKACKQIADVGRRQLFQAIELIAIFRKIAEHLTTLRLESDWDDGEIQVVFADVEKALQDSIKKKNTAGDSFEKAKKSASAYVTSHQIQINVDVRMNKAKNHDEEIMARFLPIQQRHEIKKRLENGDKSKEIDVDLHVGERELRIGDAMLAGAGTCSTPRIATAILNNKYALHAALWLLIQGGNVKLSDNTHFYSYASLHDFLKSRTSQKCLDFATTIDKIDPAPSKERLRVYALKDRPYRILLKCPIIHKNFGNIWSDNDFRVLKDICGTLHTERDIQQEIDREEISKFFSVKGIGGLDPDSFMIAEWKGVLTRASKMPNFNYVIEPATHRQMQNSGRVLAMAARINERAGSDQTLIMPGQWPSQGQYSASREKGKKQSDDIASQTSSIKSWWSRK
ncbi:hypothetical protein HWV62_21984 [Athelia sp. TMB]|nr:hypothetical protein HWV62_21984 [Athelia sp. TMB]